MNHIRVFVVPLGHTMGRPEEFPREEQVSPEAVFFHLIPEAYLSVHINDTEMSLQETNAQGR